MKAVAVSALRDALTLLGIFSSHGDEGTTLVLNLPGDSVIEVQVEAASLPSVDWVRKLHSTGGLTIVVADQIPVGVREELNDREIGWLDRRGHLRIVHGGVLIDTDVPSASRSANSRASRPAISGRSGLAAAAALLMRPSDPMGVSEIARQSGLNASSISRALKTLAEAHLAERIGRGQYRPLVPELFWALAEVWPEDRVSLELRTKDLDDPRLGAELDDLKRTGWAAGAERGAVAWGAPLVLTGDYLQMFYLPDDESIRVAQVLGGTPDQSTRAGTRARSKVEVRVDPIGLVTRTRHLAPQAGAPLAHPLFCALDLTATSRDREALEQWEPPEKFTRVW